MKKLITLIIILIAVSCNAQDTVKTFTKIYNYGKADKQVWKCFVIQHGDYTDTICINVSKIIQQGEGQAHKDIDTTLETLKQKIETDYKNDVKTFQELQTKIIKEESYLEILNYLIEEKKK